MKNMIPIHSDLSITSYLIHSLHLAVILANRNHDSWYYENYILLNAYINKETGNATFWIDYSNIHYDELFWELPAQVRDLNDYGIVEYIKLFASSATPMIIVLDEFYLQEKPAYQKYHFTHPQLIYGYDDEKEVFYACGNLQYNIFRCFEIRYQEMEALYPDLIANYNPNDYDKRITVMFVHQIGEYPFSIEHFNQKLSYYLHPAQYPLDEFRKANLALGIDVYDSLLDSLQGELSLICTPDFRAFHLLAEHKKGLLARFQYIRSAIPDNAYLELVEEYEIVSDTAERLRLFYMKKALLETKGNSFMGPIQTPCTIDLLCDKIRELKKREVEITTTVHQYLLDHQNAIRLYFCPPQQRQRRSDVHCLDLTTYFNNKAIGTVFSMESKADLYGGAYLYAPELEGVEELEIGDIVYQINIDADRPDNICCNGQVMELDPQPYRQFMILGFGNGVNLPIVADDIAQIVFTDHSVEEVVVNLPKAEQLASPFDSVVWEGVMVERKEGAVVFNYYSTFRLFSKKICITGNRPVQSIILPQSPSLRIFAVSLL